MAPPFPPGVPLGSAAGFGAGAKYPNGLEAYEHYLNGNGADREFDYGDYLENDPAGQETRDQYLGQTRAEADEKYAEIDQQVGPNEGDSITVEIHTDPASTKSDAQVREDGGGFREPASEDWQKAIGGHSSWSGSTITYTRNADGSLTASAEVTIYAEDRYNFNRGGSDIATNAPNDINGDLEEAGLAHQYTQRGQQTYRTEWRVGDPNGAGTRTEMVD
ncbi:hypothetical protein [Paracoccus sp. (in: a-proteobacteria)]|uniref:hypothetical protein n=1 Tax=Paracoccus sp. TaxID=267 RepID=UPI003A84E090